MPASMSSTLGRHLRRLQSRCAPCNLPIRQDRALQTTMYMPLAEFDEDGTEATLLHAHNVWGAAPTPLHAWNDILWSPYSQVSNTIAAAHPDKPRPAPPVTALAKVRTDVQVVPTQTGNQLVRPGPIACEQQGYSNLVSPLQASETATGQVMRDLHHGA